MRSRNAVVGGWLAGLTAGAATAAAPPPVETFFKNYAYEEALLSPGGRDLVAIIPGNEQTRAVVVSLGSRLTSPLVTFRNPDRLAALAWKTDDTLLYDVATPENDGSESHRIGVIDRDARNHALIADGSGASADDQGPIAPDALVDRLSAIPDAVLVRSSAALGHYPSVYRTALRVANNAGRTIREQMQTTQFPTERRFA